MTGVSSDTPIRLVVDGGQLEVGGTDIGAITDPVSFVVERTYYTPNFTRVQGPVMVTVRVITEVPKLRCTLTEWQMAKLQFALPDTDLSSDVSSEVLTSIPGRIEAADHQDIIFVTTKADGELITITVTNAIAQSNLEVEFPDESEAKYAVEFVGHYDPADSDDAPWSVVNILP